MSILSNIVIGLSVAIVLELFLFNIWELSHKEMSKKQIYPSWIYAIGYLLFVEIIAAVMIVFVMIFTWERW